MCLKEIEQWVHALLVMEQFGRKMPVKKLHAIANRFGKRWARERGIERFKVQLEHKIAFRSERKTEKCGK